MTKGLDNLIRDWARLGAGFTVEPARRSPDLERLILDTARQLPKEPRLFVVTASWLCQYYELVAKHRLANLVEDELETESRAPLGLLLETVSEEAKTDHFKHAIEKCRPNTDAEPLYDFQRSNAVLKKIAERRASEVSRRWGLWADPFEPKHDAIRPASWVFKHNPTYRLRESFGGDLRASIVETLRADRDAGQSELELARRCRASRDALRKALDRLTRYGHVERVRRGRNLSMTLGGA